MSSDLQKKERTIESQITEQKGQIRQAGVLVKEYVDDGYSGARLDRPALDALRRDVKTPLFDSIYFLNTLPRAGQGKINSQSMRGRYPLRASAIISTSLSRSSAPGTIFLPTINRASHGC